MYMHDACLFPTTIFPQKPWEVRSMGFSRWCRRTFEARRTNYRTTVRGSRSIQNRRQRKSNPTTHHGGTKQREWRRDYTGHDGLDPSELSLSLGQARELLEDVVLACLYVGRFGRRSVVRDIPSCGRYDVGEIPFASLPCHFNYWNGF